MCAIAPSRIGSMRNAEETQQQHVLRRHRDVRLEFVGPPAVGMLLFEQPSTARFKHQALEVLRMRTDLLAAARAPQRSRCARRIPWCRASRLRSRRPQWPDSATSSSPPGRGAPGFAQDTYPPDCEWLLHEQGGRLPVAAARRALRRQATSTMSVVALLTSSSAALILQHRYPSPF